ncbi:MAG: Fic family protein [Treponema sp.]|nr:Fic family protein [Treponema sp.]
MDAKEKLLIWKTVIALQAVDALKTSAKVIEIAKQNIEGTISDDALLGECESLKNPADVVAVRMFVNIIQNQFSLSQFELVQIRKALFGGLLESPELLRTENLSKKEWALDGHSLVYPKAGKIKSQLGKLFETETLFEFEGLDSKQIYKHCASFISGLWALHPFESCNTRTVAVFFIKYLAFRGFPLGNDVLSQSAVYFRNALARAAFCDGKKGIHKTTRYLERLIKKMMFGGRTVLDPRETHLYYDSNGVVLKSDAAAQKELSPSERLDEKLLAPKKAAAKKQADKPEPAKKRAVSAKAPSKAKKASSKKK